MTREERKEKLRHLITCMKREVSGKSCDDNCSTQYAAGNMGEIIENLEEIAKALEQEPKPLYNINREKALVEAARLIKEYCSKKQSCFNCNFYNAKEGCILYRNTPESWEV